MRFLLLLVVAITVVLAGLGVVHLMDGSEVAKIAALPAFPAPAAPAPQADVSATATITPTAMHTVALIAESADSSDLIAGDHIDIWSTSAILAGDVRIMDIHIADNGLPSQLNIVVELDDSQQQKLAAAAPGSISLSLRSLADGSTIPQPLPLDGLSNIRMVEAPATAPVQAASAEPAKIIGQ